MPYLFSASFGLVRNPVGWDNVTVVISSKPELFEVNCKLSATHYSNSTRGGQKDKNTPKDAKKLQKSKWERKAQSARCPPFIIPTQLEQGKETKIEKILNDKKNKGTKCKVSITHYRNSTRAGQKYHQMEVAPLYKHTAF